MPTEVTFDESDQRNVANTLLVEGPYDKETLNCLLSRYKRNADCQIEIGGGYESLRLGELRIRLQTGQEGQYLGIVVDADNYPDRRWESLRQVLNKEGYNAPKTLDPIGKPLIQPYRITVAVWLMPNNSSAGAMEDFLRSMVPPKNILWPHAEQVIANLPQREFSEARTRKAELYSYLAWQKAPGTRPGVALLDKKRQTFDYQTGYAPGFIKWIARIFPQSFLEGANE